jgi:Spy/CpxP family protein refolding chaperone
VGATSLTQLTDTPKPTLVLPYTYINLQQYWILLKAHSAKHSCARDMQQQQQQQQPQQAQQERRAVHEASQLHSSSSSSARCRDAQPKCHSVGGQLILLVLPACSCMQNAQKADATNIPVAPQPGDEYAYYAYS